MYMYIYYNPSFSYSVYTLLHHYRYYTEIYIIIMLIKG